MEDDLRKLDDLRGQAAIDHAITMGLQYLVGLDGVYALVDCDNTLFLGTTTSVLAYAETDRTDPASPIVERDRWDKPAHIEGGFVGVNITFDGRLLLSTDHGWLVCLARDFAEYEAVRLPGAAQEAAAHWARMEADGRSGYGWVRTSICVDEDDGIYLSSVDHTHKVVWTGDRLSLDEADGAWSARYRNGRGWGSGTTPSLMGFGPDEDHFVVIGDGDDVVNITLLWRDEIPDDWEQLPNAPSRRIAGIGPANMGNPDLAEIQTEQSITVCGYGAMTVNNEAATTPSGLGARASRLLCAFLGHDPTYTPFGLHKYEWDPRHPDLRRGLGVHHRVVAQLGAVRLRGLRPRVHVRCSRPEVDHRGRELADRRSRLPLRAGRFAVQHALRRRHARRRRSLALRHRLRKGPGPANRALTITRRVRTADTGAGRLVVSGALRPRAGRRWPGPTPTRYVPGRSGGQSRCCCTTCSRSMPRPGPMRCSQSTGRGR